MEILDAFLELVVSKDASDLFLIANATPYVKVHGRMSQVGKETLTNDKIKEIAYSLMSKKQIEDFAKRPEMNISLEKKGIGRFRVNIFQQRNLLGIVFRNIKLDIPELNTLELPITLKKLIMAKRGLFLVVGPTSSGKSTTIASLIDHRNQNNACHIVTIEDPIEYVFKNKKSLINQREIGIDTLSFKDALSNTLRQSPDIVFIGEIRDRETMEYALSFAETGMLCVSTLHASNVSQALDRIVHYFPTHAREKLMMDLSLNLSSIISQRLIPTIDSKLVPATEVFIATPLMRDLIHKGDISAISEIMERSSIEGMCTFDDSLYRLLISGKITKEEALLNADSKNNLRIKIDIEHGSVDRKSYLTLEEDKSSSIHK